MTSDIQDELTKQRQEKAVTPAPEAVEELILVPSATRSIVVGLAAFPVFCIPIVGGLASIVTAAGAIGLALSAMKIIAREPDTYSGMLRAQIGLAIGVLAVAFWLGMIALQCGPLLLE